MNASPIIEEGVITGGMVLAEDVTEHPKGRGQAEVYQPP